MTPGYILDIKKPTYRGGLVSGNNHHLGKGVKELHHAISYTWMILTQQADYKVVPGKVYGLVHWLVP